MVMPLDQHAIKYGQRRLLSRATRSVPWIGTALALLTIGSAIRRKGILRGTLDCALNATPFVGAIKNTAEIVRGRDFFADRPRNAQVRMQDAGPGDEGARAIPKKG